MFLIQAIDLDAVTVVGIIVLGDAVAVGIRIINIGNPVAVGIVLFKPGFGAAFAAARDSEGTTDDENRKQAKKEYKTFLKKYPSSRLVSAVRLELKQLNSRMARK